MDLDTSPAVEERLLAHKVVTAPRGRLIGNSDGMVAGSASSSSPERPRARSLSAPRTRQRATDLVQNLYHRMGVNYQRGQGTDLSASILKESTGTAHPFLSRPTTPANGLTTTTPSNGHTIFQRHGGDDDNADTAAGTGSEITQSRSFHERYRAATSRGRATDRAVEDAARERSDNNSRPRSLSRGRVTQRWPPARTTAEDMGSPTSSSPPQIINKQAYSPTRSSPVRPSWMESPGPVPLNSDSCNTERSVDAEEKKEDQGQDVQLGTPVSLKDRISIFGSTKSSSSTKPSRTTRYVDPKYAAQFAVRDHPPKIDIYADTKDSTATATDVTDSSTATSPNAVNEASKSQTAPPQQQQPQQHIPSTSQATLTGSGKKSGGVVMTYMSAIQSPTVPKNSKASAPVRASVPPKEIAVSAPTELGLHPNDSQSLAGLSTVSGDEFSNTQNKTAASGFSKRQNWRASQSPKNQVHTFSNQAAAALPSFPPLVSGQDDTVLENLVEDRVKERMADLESNIQTRLCQLVGAMEARVMARLDAIEKKMLHEV